MLIGGTGIGWGGDEGEVGGGVGDVEHHGVNWI